MSTRAGGLIIRDGIYYAAALAAGGALLLWLAGTWPALPLFVLAVFCLWFFRNPERTVPEGPVAVAPADGKVVAVKAESSTITRVSIFLNIFDVHVNRTPVGGTVREVKYRPGRFMVASREACSAENEQTVITVEGDGAVVVFKLIAGLIARRVVCWARAGDHVEKGARVGLIKFGSRADVLFGPEWEVTVRPGMRVAAGSSVLARRIDRPHAENRS
jgi:phosphatidylserine decarboxylase